jgi:hypothetical protein
MNRCLLFDQVINLHFFTLVSNRAGWLSDYAFDLYSKCARSNLGRDIFYPDCFHDICQTHQANAGVIDGLRLDRLHRNPFQI